MTLMFCSQFLGKSSLIEGILAWQIDQDPSAVVVVHPTAENAQIWSKNRLTPLIESIPVLRRLVSRKNTQVGADKLGSGFNTLTHKVYPGGWIVAGGANSAAQLTAHTARLTVFDEVDRYPEMVGKKDHEEGDVIVLVEQRSARFTNAFSIRTSTPTVTGFSRIEKEYECSDMRKWFVKCPKCKQSFVIQWLHIKWPRELDGSGNVIDEDPSAAYLECPCCRRHFSDLQRQELVRRGRWIATKPKVKSRRGYWANAFLVIGPPKSGYTSWLHYFVDRYLAEQATTKGLREWQNLVCGESYELETDPPPDFLELHGRREQYAETDEGELILPERVLMLSCGIDVQRDRVEMEVIGWGLGDETWGIEYRVIRGNPQLPAFWTHVDQYIIRQWKHPSGHRLSPYYTLIDTGDKPGAMYAFVRKCAPRLVFATKGYAGFAPNWCNRSGGSNQRLFILKVDTPKETLYSNLRLTEPGPGYCHFPSNSNCGYDETYFSQLTAERLVLGGASPHFALRAQHARNEALDVRVLNLACREIADPDYSKAQAWLASAPLNDWRPKPPPVPSEPPSAQVEVPPILIRPGAPPKPEIVAAGKINNSPPPGAPRRIPGTGYCNPW